MRKQTAWLLIILLGTFLTFLVVAKGRVVPFPKMLAQVGIEVGVAPNPYNTLASELDQEQTQLTQEKADLDARETALASSTVAATTASPAVWYLTLAIAILALLVLANFYFDWRRAQRDIMPPPPHPQPQSPESPRKESDIIEE